jgi:hypothetical protein
MERNSKEKHTTELSTDGSFEYLLSRETFSFFRAASFFKVRCSLSGSSATEIYIYILRSKRPVCIQYVEVKKRIKKV